MDFQKWDSLFSYGADVCEMILTLPRTEKDNLPLFRTHASLWTDERRRKKREAPCSSGIFPASCRGSGLFLLPLGSQVLDVACQNRQGDISLKAVDAMIRTAVQPMHFQGVDGRFDRRMLASGRDEYVGRFKRLFFRGETSFLRQYRYI